MKGASTLAVQQAAPRLLHGSAAGPRITVGIVNNMPDAALASTERQFLRLLAPAARGLDLDVRLFHLPDAPREDAARSQLLSRYAPIDALPEAGIDALIVTGCEPRRPSLSDEPYWPSLVRLVEWARHNTVSTMWSCLAAHAAVLHLDGIERRPLKAKMSGVYAFGRTGDHPLLSGAGSTIHVPHSRQNGLDAADLARCGYDVLTGSDGAGVDTFVKRYSSLFVFLQGHPEYGPDTLHREYRRDMERFLRGAQSALPRLPEGTYDAKETLALKAFADQARAVRDPALLQHFPRIKGRTEDEARWTASSVRLFANWLRDVARAKAGRVEHASS